MLSPFTEFLTQLTNPMFASSAIRVALVVGSILFTINHGAALIQGNMTLDRWLSALLTYCIPYIVNIHGQYTTYAKIQRANQSDPSQTSEQEIAEKQGVQR